MPYYTNEEAGAATLSLFFKHAGQYKLLTAEDEIRLFTRLRQGDISAAEEIALSNLRLVAKIAKKYQGFGMDYLDLIQEGYFGLARAIEDFDIDSGNKFSTYATWWIRSAVTRAVGSLSRSVRLPQYMHDRVVQFDQTRQALRRELGRDVSDEEIAARLDESVEEVQYLASLMDMTVSLDETLNPAEETNKSRGSGSTRHNYLAFHGTPETIVVDREARAYVIDQVRRVLSRLDQRSRSIVLERFGFIDGRPKTLEEVGQEYGVTRERIRQIESKALEAIERALTAERATELLGLLERSETGHFWSGSEATSGRIRHQKQHSKGKQAPYMPKPGEGDNVPRRKHRLHAKREIPLPAPTEPKVPYERERAEAAVRAYLDYVKSPKQAQAEVTRLEKLIERVKDPIEKLQLHTKLIDARAANDILNLEAEFVALAGQWAREEGISRRSFQTIGVSVEVLERSGI